MVSRSISVNGSRTRCAGAWIGQTSKQQINGHPAGLLQGLVDGCQTDEVGNIDVVKPDNGQLPGDGHTALPGSFQHAHRLVVAGSEDRRGRLRKIEQPMCRETCILPAVRRKRHILVGQDSTGRGQGS